MKTITVNLWKVHLLVLAFVMSLSSCNKEDLNASKVIHVGINGYNGSDSELMVSIDTAQFEKNFIVKAKSIVQFDAAHLYNPSRPGAILSMKEINSNKEVFRATLPTAGIAIGYNYILIDNKELAIPEIKPSPPTNKISYFVHNVGTTEPFDMYIHVKDSKSEKSFMYPLAKNVKPETWFTIDYIAPKEIGTQQLLMNNTSTIRCVKPGTTDQWAFFDSEAKSTTYIPVYKFPIASSSGLVQHYFVTPDQNQLQTSPVFLLSGLEVRE